MKIQKLTAAVIRQFLSRRRIHDEKADRVATRILADVRRTGDAALFRYSLRFDQNSLTPENLWIRRDAMRDARNQVSPELLDAIEHSARNIRRVAEEQRPRTWTISVEPGVKVSQRVTPLDSVGCYIPGGRFSFRRF